MWLVCLVYRIKKIYAKIVAKEGELDGLTGELRVAYKAASRSDFFRPDGKKVKKIN